MTYGVVRKSRDAGGGGGFNKGQNIEVLYCALGVFKVKNVVNS